MSVDKELYESLPARAVSLCCTRRNAVHKRAFVKSSALRWFLGDLQFKGNLPRPDYIHRIIENFRESSSPDSMRSVAFSPDKILCEYISASCHLPGAYAEFFPCTHCTHTEEEDDDYEETFIEVFHVPYVHEPNVCATVTFTMPGFYSTLELHEPMGCSVEVEVTKGCPNAPIAVDHSPRVALHIDTDVFIKVLLFLTRSELETAQLVSCRWSDVIRRTKGTLQQRRILYVIIKFYGESPGMLSVYFLRRDVSGQERILRVLTPRGLSQALYVVRSHLRNAFVEAVHPLFLDSVPPPVPPQEVLVDISLPHRINWLMSLLRSLPLNAVINAWKAQDIGIGLGNLPTLARCALRPHRMLGRVQKLELTLLNPDATWAQLAGLLNQPSVRGFSEITILTTKVAIDASEFRTLLASLQSPRLHVAVLSSIEPHNALLTQPAQIIRDFLDLHDAPNFIAEFSLYLVDENVAFSELPSVDKATNRWKRFWHCIHGYDTPVQVIVYENRSARKKLTVVTFDHFPSGVLFLKGNVTLDDLKSLLQRPSVFD